VNKLPTQYEQYVHLSRYARWDKEKGRRETWDETVTRYFDFFDGYLSDKHNYHLGAELQDLYDAVINLEVMPSMRCLMTAGKALARDHVAGYNPVVGDTKVLTREYGMIDIEQLAGKTATVLNKNSEWTEAEFNSYGEQAVYKVILKLNSNTINEVECTRNHRWLLQGGVVLSTESLRIGDKIDFINAPKIKVDENNLDYRLGVIHGLVYGDGTATYSCERLKGYHIRLCSDAASLLKWFKGYPVSYPPTANGDPVVMIYDGFAKTHSLKQLPNHEETEEYLVGFIRGWLAADGSVGKRSGQISLCCKKEGKDWLKRVAPKVGFIVQNTRQQTNETNYGKRKSESWIISFSRSSMVREDFIIPRKAKRFKPLKSHYVVSEVINMKKKQEVFCAEVPDTNTFVLDRGLVTGNCSYRMIDDPRAFDEILFILMCGTGVGFSVERQYVNKLPKVPESFDETTTTITVRDSKRGWGEGYRELIAMLYAGRLPKWDVSKLRPAGARLKTMGGRSSGPGPLVELFEFTVKMFKNAAGRKLTSLECHDLACKIGDCVVVGGVRRSAMLSLSNLSDQRMRDAKSGQWWELEPQRQLANNSVAYTETPEVGQFMTEWLALFNSKSGERGIFNREAATDQAISSGRRKAFWDEDGEFPIEFGCNPCSEIILRSKQLCNLTEVICRPDDTEETLVQKVKYATILGTWQACLTDFRYLTKKWQRNCEEEALLGVSLTGIMDCPLLIQNDFSTDHVLDRLKEIAIETNKEWAEKLGINQATAITCVKPSGTVSQLTNAASGIHPRHAPYYIRRVRQDRKDPMAQFMIDKGFPNEVDVTSDQTVIFSFPIRAPEGSVFRDDKTAVEQLNHWLMLQNHWCEHKPSITVTVREHEWPEVGAWVWRHFSEMSGVSFLPHSDHSYKQAPYEEVTEEVLKELEAKMPIVDWSELDKYESEDNTVGTHELSCSAGNCEI
jgi:ribonucleoside-diphosphate reductase alpha chain